MKMFLRLFWIIFTQSWRSRVDLFDTVETSLRVYPSDLDLFMHVNNGVYLTYADIGRTDLMLRADVFHPVRKQGWYPVVAAETIQFKRSLTLWQRFEINSRIIGWDDRSIYMEQKFTQKEHWVATAIIHAQFLSKTGGKVTVPELFELLGMNQPSPEIPEHVQLWIDSVKLSRDAQVEPR